MSTPAPPSTATTAVQPVEEAPVAVPDDDASMSSDDIKALSRTFTTPDGVPITIMKKPSAEIVRRQSTIPKGTSIDGVISPQSQPQPRPARSFPSAAPPPRLASPTRAITEPFRRSLGRPIFPEIVEPICLFPDHTTIREVTVIINSQSVTDREGGLLFKIDRRMTFRESNDHRAFGLVKTLIPWKRKWYLDINGVHKLTFKRRRTKGGRRALLTQLPGNSKEPVVDVILQNGMMRIGHTNSLLVAIVEDVKHENNRPVGRRMRVAKGFDLAVASAMCYILYGGVTPPKGSR